MGLNLWKIKNVREVFLYIFTYNKKIEGSLGKPLQFHREWFQGLKSWKMFKTAYKKIAIFIKKYDFTKKYQSYCPTKTAPSFFRLPLEILRKSKSLIVTQLGEIVPSSSLCIVAIFQRRDFVISMEFPHGFIYLICKFNHPPKVLL